ncbi:MAG TPA: DUF1931 family protein, partial [Acidimicrobiales bacterium]|nr:DUF1931 family protein [Acidimicrobiales bacterium]
MGPPQAGRGHRLDEGGLIMVMGVTQFQRLFREAASIDLDKDDIKRLDDFVTARLHDLLLMAQRLAKANGRPVIDWIDVPLT